MASLTPRNGKPSPAGLPVRWKWRIPRAELIAHLVAGKSHKVIGAKYGLTDQSIRRAIGQLRQSELADILKGRVNQPGPADTVAMTQTALPRMDPLRELLAVLEGAKAAQRELDELKTWLTGRRGTRAIKAAGTRFTLRLSLLDRRYQALDRVVKSVEGFLNAAERLERALAAGLTNRILEEAVDVADAEARAELQAIMARWRAGEPAPEADPERTPLRSRVAQGIQRARQWVDAHRTARVVVGVEAGTAATEGTHDARQVVADRR